MWTSASPLGVSPALRPFISKTHTFSIPHIQYRIAVQVMSQCINTCTQWGQKYSGLIFYDGQIPVGHSACARWWCLSSHVLCSCLPGFAPVLMTLSLVNLFFLKYLSASGLKEIVTSVIIVIYYLNTSMNNDPIKYIVYLSDGCSSGGS